LKEYSLLRTSKISTMTSCDNSNVTWINPLRWLARSRPNLRSKQSTRGKVSIICSKPFPEQIPCPIHQVTLHFPCSRGISRRLVDQYRFQTGAQLNASLACARGQPCGQAVKGGVTVPSLKRREAISSG
jgi:hypothetical protein